MAWFHKEILNATELKKREKLAEKAEFRTVRIINHVRSAVFHAGYGMTAEHGYSKKPYVGSKKHIDKAHDEVRLLLHQLSVFNRKFPKKLTREDVRLVKVIKYQLERATYLINPKASFTLLSEAGSLSQVKQILEYDVLPKAKHLLALEEKLKE